MTLTSVGAVRLRPSIVVLFVAMVLPVFAASIWVGYASNDRMARDTAQKTIDRSRLETISQTEALLNPIASLVRVSSRVAGEQPDFYRSDKALPSMMEVLAHSANISSVYVGFADGSYRMALRVPKNLRIQNTAPPEGTQFATRWLDRRAAGATVDRYTFMDGAKKELGVLNTPAQYDPRVRPWFKDATDRKDLVISNPYIYATTGLPGVTIAMPFYAGGKLEGVLAIDILLDSLSQYLKTRPVSANSISLIVDNDGPDRRPPGHAAGAQARSQRQPVAGAAERAGRHAAGAGLRQARRTQAQPVHLHAERRGIRGDVLALPARSSASPGRW